MANENRSAQRGADKPKRNGWRVFGRVIGTIVLVGVLTVLVFALCRQWHIGRLPELAAMLVINGWLLPSADMTLWGVTLPVELLATAALLPIWLYRGRQGPHGPWLRWVWYGFYPAHLLVLWLIYTKTC